MHKSWCLSYPVPRLPVFLFVIMQAVVVADLNSCTKRQDSLLVIDDGTYCNLYYYN